MRFSMIIFLFILSFNTDATVEHMLKILASGKASPEVSDQCSLFTEWNRDATTVGPVKLDCPTDWYAKKFHFDLAYYHCQTRYGKSAQTCSEQDQTKIMARTNDAALMDKIKNFTKNRFQEYKMDLAKKCCGTKEQCLIRFESTILTINNEPKTEASYLSDSSPNGRSIIDISERKLATAMNQESVERILLVELAHSCQFALISESDADYAKFTSDRCSIDSGRLMFKEGLDPEVGSCVDKELQSQIAAIPDANRGKYCFGKWYREAFSDMKFRSEFKSIYHWTYDFLRRSQHTNYGSVYKYISCGVTQDLKDQVCK